MGRAILNKYNTQTNRRVIFISHSHLDNERAKSIKELLDCFIHSNVKLRERYDVYYAPHNLQSPENDRWRRDILEAINNTVSFVVLYTANSLYSRWVNFEIGAALRIIEDRSGSAILGGPKFIPIGVERIDMDKALIQNESVKYISRLSELGSNTEDKQRRTSLEANLYGEKSIEKTENIQSAVGLSNGPSSEDNDVITILKEIFYDSFSVGLDVEGWCRENKDAILKFRQHVAGSTAYIVGSKPKKKFSSKDEVWEPKETERFVSALTKNLIDAHYSTASSPKVAAVGGAVAKATLDYSSNMESYRILGLYRMEDAIPKGSSIDQHTYPFWQEAIRKHRAEYLKTIDCYIIIGGNANTKDEYNEAIKYKHIRIFPLPCFGGFGRQLFEHLLTLINKDHIESGMHNTELYYPCIKCNRKRIYNNESDSFKCIEQLVKSFDTYHEFKWGKL